MRITISGGPFTSWKIPFCAGELQSALRTMYAALFEAAEPVGELELALVDAAEMAQLNSRHLGCAGPTNILSFQTPGHMPGPGWLVLCADVLRLESLLYGQSLEQYTIRMLAHGMGHLAGHEHGEDMDAACARAEAAAFAALKEQGGGS